MKRLFRKRKANRLKHLVFNKLDTHKWAAKMEIHRLLSGRAGMVLKAGGRCESSNSILNQP